jgi:hypothetical protein
VGAIIIIEEHPQFVLLSSNRATIKNDRLVGVRTMRIWLSALAFCLLLFAAPYPSNAVKLDFLGSVRPLTIFESVDEEGIAVYRNICTAVSINEIEHIWLTAAHCVLTEVEGEMGIEMGLRQVFIGTGIMSISAPATVLEVNGDTDLAVLQTPDFYVVGVKFGKQPKMGQEILVAGHPFGYPDIFLTRGYIANPSALLDPGYRRKMIFDVAGAPGNSGSPVFNTRGELVSILQIGWSRSFSPVTGGALWGDVKVITAKYWAAP